MFPFFKKLLLISAIITSLIIGITIYQKTQNKQETNQKNQEPKKDWGNISHQFTSYPILIKQWTKKGFTYEQTKEWIDIGLKPNESNLVNWLVKEKKGSYANPEWMLNSGDMKELKCEYHKEQRTKYPALIITEQEPEYKNNFPLPISSAGTDNKVKRDRNLPAGSALSTDSADGYGRDSSALKVKGITKIIHAAPEPRGNFASDEQFIECVVKSVQNSIILADRNYFSKLAIPFVGSGLYLGSCDPQELAEAIVHGAFNQLEECIGRSLEEIILVDFEAPFYLEQAFKKIKQEFSTFSFSTKSIQAIQGDICSYTHQARAIVNAANTQVQFGAGLSGKIAKQVGDPKKIDQKAQELIKEFNQNIV